MRLFLTSILTVAFFSVFGQSTDITQDELKTHIYYLSSDSLKGRYPGTPEMEVAARYINNFLQNSGVSMVGETGLQPFDVTTNISMGLENMLSSGDSVYVAGKDFVPYAFTANASLSADIVFVGYGFNINRKELVWNDFNGIDVKGKWVLMLTGDPEIDSAKSVFADFSGDRQKTISATDAGAAGVLLVSGPMMDQRDKLISLHFDKTMGNSGVPVFNIKRKVADYLLRNSGYNVAQLEEKLNKEHKSMSMPLNTQATGLAHVNQIMVKTSNVMGFVGGSDPVLKNDIIVIGAHYDHLGFGGSESGSRMPDTIAVHNGADDNASGVAAIMEIAQKIAANRAEFKRSVLIIAFSAEEMGLLGSKYFVNHPAFKLSQLKAMVNLDMIGRLKDDQTVLLAGVGTSIEGPELLKNMELKAKSLKFGYSPDGFGPSDHASFYSEKVPVFFLSTGAHDEYHTPFDDADKINFTGEKDIADYSYELVKTLANLDKNLTYQESDMTDQRQRGRRGFNVTLGIMPDYAATGTEGLRIDGIRKGGSADLGGMKKGDIITAIDGKSIKNIYDYMHRLNTLEKGKTASVDVLREGQHVILLISL